MDEEKISVLRDLQENLGSPMSESLAVKPWKEEIRECISGIVLFLGFGFHVYCSFKYINDNGTYWGIVGVASLWGTLFLSNCLTKLSKLIDGDKGFASSIIFLLYGYLLQLSILASLLALLFKWEFGLLLILPWLTYTVVGHYQENRQWK